MTLSNTTQSCLYSPDSGPVGFLPGPNIFPLAKEKMFWNFQIKRHAWNIFFCLKLHSPCSLEFPFSRLKEWAVFLTFLHYFPSNIRYFFSILKTLRFPMNVVIVLAEKYIVEGMKGKAFLL